MSQKLNGGTTLIKKVPPCTLRAGDGRVIAIDVHASSGAVVVPEATNTFYHSVVGWIRVARSSDKHRRFDLIFG